MGNILRGEITQHEVLSARLHAEREILSFERLKPHALAGLDDGRDGRRDDGLDGSDAVLSMGRRWFHVVEMLL